MTILFVDGCTDRLQRQGKYEQDLLGGISFLGDASRHGSGPTVPRHTAPSIGGGSVADRLGKELDPSRFVVAAGLAMRHHGSDTGTARPCILQFRAGATIIAQVGWIADDTGTLYLSTNTGTTGEVSRTANRAASAWKQVSVLIEVNEADPAQGTWEWYLGDEFLGQGVANFGDQPVTEVAWSQSMSGNSNNRHMGFEDFWITDGEMLFDARITTLRPNAVGNANAWEPSDALEDNFALVADEFLNRDRYVSTDTDGARDLYGFGDLLADEERPDVRAVVATVVATKTDAAARSIELTTRVGSTNYDSAAIEVPFEVVEQVRWDDNPATAEPWTKGEVDAAEFGFRAVIPAP